MDMRDNRGSAPLIVLIVILAVAALGFAGIAYWQSMNGTKEATALKDQLTAAQQLAEQKDQEAAQAKADAEAQAKATMAAQLKASEVELGTVDLAFSGSLQDIETCDKSTVASDISIQQVVTAGLAGYISKGYLVGALCNDTKDRRIGAILYKGPATTSTCVDSCDEDLVVSIDNATARAQVTKLVKPLGLVNEAYNQFCYIDGVTADMMYVYCGSGESGGITSWYSVNVNDGSVNVVQTMTGFSPANKATYKIDDATALANFQHKTFTLSK